MKMLNAWTIELDEPAVAVATILEQLDLEKNLCKNSVGFLTCSYDFIETGVVSAISEALPFDVIGCTTLTNANNEDAGTMLLCLSVLTSDDCNFAAQVTGSLRGDLKAEVSRAVNEAKAELNEPVKMALAFMPMFGIGGEIMLSAMNDELEEVPIFGMVACDHDTANYSNTYVAHNGRHYNDCLAFILLSGNVNPRFVVTTTSEQNMRKQHAEITLSEGSVVKKINDLTAQEYLETIGLGIGKGFEALTSIPFMLDYNDGSQPVARALYFGKGDDGSIVAGGLMPEGAMLHIGRMDVPDIILTAGTSVKRLMEEGDVTGIIMFPCLGRNMVLVADPMAEIDEIRQAIGDEVRWHLAYAAGECCPVLSTDNKWLNRFHNFTFIGCAI